MLEKLLLAAAITTLLNMGTTLKLPGSGSMSSDRNSLPQIERSELSWRLVSPQNSHSEAVN